VTFVRRPTGLLRFVARLLAIVASLGGLAGATDRPNVLVILADDCTFNDLPPYGGRNAKTPHIDTLARDGLVFDRAYVGMSMCVPCRAELFTGQYAFTNGCVRNHAPCRAGTRSLPHHLGPLGYRVGIAGKVHVQPAESFPFEFVPGFDGNCTRDPTRPHDLAGIRGFLSADGRERRGDAGADRFCLVVGLVEPHMPWVMGDATRFPPDRIALPPNLADTPRTREEFARYLAEVESMDAQVGEILAVLRETGHADDTLVLFTSEQGSQFPGNKWTCYDTGLHTALVARWPGRVPAGRRTSAVVQYADVAPTLVELAGGDPKASCHSFDGTNFVPVLRGASDRHRDYAYGIHNNEPEGPEYPIRSVTDGEWRYIRNLTPDVPYVENHVMGLTGNRTITNDFWPTWVEAARTDPTARRLVDRYTNRPGEELYHTASDPYEQTNRAAEPAARAVRARLSAELDRWLGTAGARATDPRER
jgi:uncharacterized sulfatase